MCHHPRLPKDRPLLLNQGPRSVGGALGALGGHSGPPRIPGGILPPIGGALPPIGGALPPIGGARGPCPQRAFPRFCFPFTYRCT